MGTGKIERDGWNKKAAMFGPFWYMRRGMVGKGVGFLVLCAVTLGLGIIPTWIYCGYRGNRDFTRYRRRNNIFIS